MRQRTTRIVLGIALFTTGIAAWFAPAPESNEVALSDHTRKLASGRVAPVPKPAAAFAPTTGETLTAARTAVDVLSIRDRAQEDGEETEEGQLFTTVRWTPPVKSVSVATPVATVSAPPQAPPLPFRVLGRYEEGGQTTIFLQHNDLNIVVRVGDIVADQYKIESLKGGTMTLRYLPLDQIQSLDVGGTQ